MKFVIVVDVGRLATALIILLEMMRCGDRLLLVASDLNP
jgi:hypothetical protein